MHIQTNYLNSTKELFRYYKQLGESTFEQLTEAELFWQYSETNNSIAVIVNHLWGNMLSRWTNFLTEDGEKEWRKRDIEFEDVIQTKAQFTERWEAGWACLFEALDSVNEENFDSTIYIRNMGHTIIEAVNRQLAHYAYHIGQIVFIGTLIKGESWTSLSIPRGKSTDYNQEKFAQDKRKDGFTTEYLRRHKES